jgi:hypothetical protein
MKYLDGKPIADLGMAFQRKDDETQYMTYFEANQLRRAKNEAIQRAARIQSDTEADQHSWTEIGAMFLDKATAPRKPLKRLLYRFVK